MSEQDFVDSNIGVIIDVLDDVMDVCENDEKKKYVIVAMLDSSLQPLLCNIFPKHRWQQFIELLHRLQCDLVTFSGPTSGPQVAWLLGVIKRPAKY
ncbi:hypothetical protein TELCIR_03745 [Teladorsagia circumcincta]|uniref:Uncharacterized protein n=1 Tax=Teladorsagia circumcincta TaxID=45464 RepID=A0A2G9UXK1_TELCI|nr:hypothetical protein TELCIR_03745 [Teladorsagia circumcincta]